MFSKEQMDEWHPERQRQYVLWFLFLVARSYSFRANTVPHENIIRVGRKMRRDVDNLLWMQPLPSLFPSPMCRDEHEVKFKEEKRHSS